MTNTDGLRRDLLLRAENLIGAKILSHRRVEGGYTPALRFLCKTSNAGIFVKIGATPLTSEFINREIDVYNRLSGDFMPQLIASEKHDSEPILIIEDLSMHHWAPPWNERQIDLALEQVEAMHKTAAALDSYAQTHEAGEMNWQSVADDPKPFLSLGAADLKWLESSLPILLWYERNCSTAGESLTHWDLRSDNICITPGRAIFVDWNLACLSNAKLDLGFWLPSLAFETGLKPEKILPDAPEVAAWVSGFFAARAGLPEITDAPRVRAVQRQQLSTALPWAVRALELPALPDSDSAGRK